MSCYSIYRTTFVKFHSYCDDTDERLLNLYDNYAHKKVFDLEGNLSVTTVEVIGGSEGEGDEVMRVYRVDLDNVPYCAIAVYGSYSSHFGIDWFPEDTTFVHAKQVISIDWVNAGLDREYKLIKLNNKEIE